ncbi:hypothetical protein BDV96DRAFT_566203 [Lophiotrema nucula]|uniref:N-acetyltransferase domain-containing protein n=1 Tax=Lophiotrema nucula TaxID=690887 RepID=A0A6A5ZLZ2_9PLEO|nr:hypothetical protein BDV96DRAFT_566203 [Lophiotrema nucula]
MKTSDIFYFGLKLQAFLLPQYHPASYEQQVLGHEARLRNATLEDADDISTVIIAAFGPLPDWQYIYQFRKQYPEEHRNCIRYGVGQILSDPSTHAQVIEAPADSAISLVAFAIWSQHNESRRGLNGFSHFLSSNCTHKDLNFTRGLDFNHKFTAQKKRYIDKGDFGTDQLYLAHLGTHPKYQLRGAGTRLVGRGIEVGKRDGVNVTLIAQPTAETFYVHLGFTSVANISVKTVDDEVFRYPVMKYNFSGEAF